MSPALEATLSLAWFGILLAAATWMRFDAWPWELMQ